MNVFSSSIRLSSALAVVSTLQLSSLEGSFDYAGDYLSLQLFRSFAILVWVEWVFNQSILISLSLGVACQIVKGS